MEKARVYGEEPFSRATEMRTKLRKFSPLPKSLQDGKFFLWTRGLISGEAVSPQPVFSQHDALRRAEESYGGDELGMNLSRSWKPQTFDASGVK